MKETQGLEIRNMVGKIMGARHQRKRRSNLCNRRSPCQGRKSPDDHTLSLANDSNNHVVIVMDGMKEFSSELLEWALKNIISAGSVITLLGVMPWLNIPLSVKTWLDVWSLELEELPFVREKNEWKSDAKYLKLQTIVDLCRNYGVLLEKKVVMGYPSRSMIVEKVASLHATWVVFDRHQKKNSDFYAKKIQCNMVVVNEDGEFDIINKGSRQMIDNSGCGWPRIACNPFAAPNALTPDNSFPSDHRHQPTMLKI
ncbi:uncharacterized protein LOC125419109 [Ziziphus jujuba]|uniref:Uncharacterized protein LOC125419109 n=1 Tax=Ziziphus jujuba TaxID=326968 RepID=A0ABM3I471_ZIZJJ|nr:uncharacterized protein LOC125419109 [Ziziphus jujuba]